MSSNQTEPLIAHKIVSKAISLIELTNTVYQVIIKDRNSDYNIWLGDSYGSELMFRISGPDDYLYRKDQIMTKIESISIRKVYLNEVGSNLKIKLFPLS